MFRSYLNLVEIRTKVASVFPMLFGFFLMLQKGIFRPIESLLFFLSLVTLDMATTVWNNVQDENKVEESFNYRELNPVMTGRIPRKKAYGLYFFLLVISFITGLLLVLRTDIYVLLLGLLSFFVGFLYSYKPLALNRLPIGELVSGSVMGFGIVFLSCYIQLSNPKLFFYEEGYFTIHLLEMVKLLLHGLPFFFLIANIMLMNNTCDIEEDALVGRKTLPTLIGRKNATALVILNMLAVYVSIVFNVALGLFPRSLLLSLVTAFWTVRNTITFQKNPSKEHTFKYAIINFFIVSLTLMVLLMVKL
ncbi:UbiA family prenyltransferase [Guggenheimella bovis]